MSSSSNSSRQSRSPTGSSYSSSRSTSPARSPRSNRSSPDSDMFIKIGVVVVSAIIIVTILIYIAGLVNLGTSVLSSEQFQSVSNKILIYFLTILGSAAGAYYYFRN